MEKIIKTIKNVMSFFKKIRLDKNWCSTTFMALPSRYLLVFRSDASIVNFEQYF